MLTNQDLKQIKNIVEVVVEEKLEEKLDEKLKFLPTTDVFLAKMDEVMGELQKSRDEQDLLTYRVSQHTDDIVALQDIHPQNKHIAIN